MKRILLSLGLVWLSLVAVAQVRFGYLSYSDVCHRMPEYARAQQNLDDLRAAYDKEAKHNEEEFQRRFADFLEGQKDFPKNILQKRQAELQDLMNKSIAFRHDCEQLLASAERDLMHVVEEQLDEAIRQVGYDGGYAYIVNTDAHALPFVSPLLGDDVTELVLQRLGIAVPEAKPEEPLVPEEKL